MTHLHPHSTSLDIAMHTEEAKRGDIVTPTITEPVVTEGVPVAVAMVHPGAVSVSTGEGMTTLYDHEYEVEGN